MNDVPCSESLELPVNAAVEGPVHHALDVLLQVEDGHLLLLAPALQLHALQYNSCKIMYLLLQVEDGHFLVLFNLIPTLRVMSSKKMNKL